MRRRRGTVARLGIAALALVASVAARAAELRITVRDQRRAAVADAVVTVTPQPAGATVAPPRPAAQTKTIDQVGLAFVPYLEVFRPGDRVVFRNSDRTRHHVYSFSPAKSFEMMLDPAESSAPLELDRAGVVAIGCNIHDAMLAYLYVSDAPWIARSGARGEAAVGDLPAGSYAVRVWQPRLRPGKPDVVQSVVVAAGETRALAFSLSLLPDTRRQLDGERSSY